MANPLSDRGWSDHDYAAAIGTLVGEAAVKGTLQDYQAIADVIANRQHAGVYGKTVAGITMSPREFSTWSPTEESAFANARAGFAAALSPTRAASLSPALRDRVELAKKAVEDVNVTGIARGLTQGATAYHNPDVTAKLGTGAWHNKLEGKFGGLTIGDHRFTGQGFRAGQAFDPVTYNGQLAAPPATMPDTFFDVGIPTGAVDFLGDLPDPTLGAPPIGKVEAYSIPDVTPASAGFSLDGATLPDGLSLDFASPMDTGTFNDVFSTGFSPSTPMSKDTFSDVFDAGFPTQKETGFVAGVDAGPWGATPDFSAPSLDARNAMDRAQGSIAGWNGNSWNSSDLNNEAIANSVMAELAPSTPPLSAPALASTVSAPPQATTPAPSYSTAPMGDFDTFPSAPPSTAPAASTAPARAAPTTTSLPAAPAPSDAFSLGPIGYSKDKGLTLGGFSNPVDAISSSLGFGMPNESFMNAMASPQHAQSYSPGFLDSAFGRTATGALQGAMFGGLPGAAIGGLMGGTGWGNAMSNQLGDFLGSAWDHMSQGWGSYDHSTHGYGAGFNDRGERSHTGRNESGNATVGDGSYGERSGTNPNNPQGII
jgi:hypothetical protein